MRHLWDRVTLPFWRWRFRRTERRLFRKIGRGDEERGRRIFELAMRDSVEGSR